MKNELRIHSYKREHQRDLWHGGADRSIVGARLAAGGWNKLGDIDGNECSRIGERDEFCPQQKQHDPGTELDQW